MRGIVAFATVLAIALTGATAFAHGFGQRFDLPVPMWIWVSGAALTVVLSFAVIIDFLPARLESLDYPRARIEGPRGGAIHAQLTVMSLARGTSVAIFLTTIIAGFVGNAEPGRNLAPTMLWVGFWVGLAFVSALLGDVWAALNPLRIVFQWIDGIHRRVTLRALAPLLPYPRALAAWPAVVLMVIFAGAEHLAENAAVPNDIAVALVAYSAFTWIAMLAFGSDIWLRNGEVFTVFFSLFARFAPLEIRPPHTGAASKERPSGRVWLRPPAVGLLGDREVSFSMVVFVMVVLSSVTFDGFIETPLWHEVLARVVSSSIGAMGSGLVTALVMLVFPLLFLLAFWTCCLAMSAIAGGGERAAPSTSACARRFVLTLVPIAIAYHFAHYLTLLLTAGQSLIPLISDPFGWDWNLFGTADYVPEIGLVGVKTVWWFVVCAIVIGHVLAVYLAHVVALNVMQTRAVAVRSQIPLLALMVAYTMTSLWIVAQPIVD